MFHLQFVIFSAISINRFSLIHFYLQESLRALWHAAYPDIPLKGLISDQWKEMGWQGPNPSTDFRYSSIEQNACLCDNFTWRLLCISLIRFVLSLKLVSCIRNHERRKAVMFWGFLVFLPCWAVINHNH